MTKYISRKKASGSTRRHVYVTVAGGVAYAAYAPKDVEVHILDFDDLEADYAGTSAKYSPAERDFLRQIEAQGTEC